MQRSIRSQLALVALLSLRCMSVADAQTSYSFNPTDDVFVRENAFSYEAWGKLKTDETIGFRKRGFLRFDASSVSGTVASATLRLYVQKDTGAFEVVELKDEDTWKDLPDNIWTWDDRYEWCGLSQLADGICKTTGYAESEWICGNGQDCSNTFIDVDVSELVEWDVDSGVLLFGLQERERTLEMSSDNDSDAARRPTLIINTDGDPLLPVMTHGPTTGGVTHNQAVLWVRTNVSASVDFLVSRSSSMRGAQISSPKTTTAESDFTARIAVWRLQPNTRYYYLPRIDGKPVDIVPTPYFQTAPRPGSEQAFSFVLLTDFQTLAPTTRDETPATFQSAAGEAPAFSIIGGDVDHRDPGWDTSDLSLVQQRTRTMYKENFDRSIPRRRDFVDYIQRRGAMAHLWDDHDYGANDEDGDYLGKYVALQTYDEYWPSYARPAPDQGIYHSWNWGQVQFVLLDGRFHRTDSDAPDDYTKTMLGETQKAWLKQTLLNSTAVWKVVLSGSVFNPTVKCGADNWCEYWTEGREIAEFIRDNEIENVVILSGDIHAGAITNGTNSVYNTPWEMATPGVDVALCDTTTFVGPDKFGEWTHGTWGEGYRLLDPPLTCWGYGHIDVLTNPHRMVLTVNNDQGQPQVQGTVYAEP